MVEPTSLSKVLLNALNHSGVRFVHWKSNIHLDDALAGNTDLDILVHPDDRDSFIIAVINTGFVKIISQPWASYPDVEDWLGMDIATTKFLHLHVHYQLVTGLKRVKHLYLPWGEQVLANCINHSSGWPMPNRTLETVVFFIRIWAKMPVHERLRRNPAVPGHVVEELQWLLSTVEVEEISSTMGQLNLRAEGLLENIKEIKQGDTRKIPSVSKALYNQTIRYYRLNWTAALLLGFFRFTVYAWRRLLEKYYIPVVLRKRISAGGVMIAIVGSDGSGKSTLSRDLNSWLRYKLDSHILYLGSGDGDTGFIFNFVKRIRVVVAKLFQTQDNPKKKISNINEEVSIFKKLYRILYLLLLRRKVKLIKYASSMATNGSIILFDRYPQVEFYGINDGPKLQNGQCFEWAARYEMKLIREAVSLGPDFVIKLLVEPGSALKRKPDHDINEISRKCQIVNEIKFNNVHCIEIDANRQYNEVLYDVRKNIWSILNKND